MGMRWGWKEVGTVVVVVRWMERPFSGDAAVHVSNVEESQLRAICIATVLFVVAIVLPSQSCDRARDCNRGLQ